MGIAATVVRPVRLSNSVYKAALNLLCGLIVYPSCADCVADRGGHAEGERARLAEGPGLCREHFPSF